jgi:hypothetical protein
MKSTISFVILILIFLVIFLILYLGIPGLINPVPITDLSLSAIGDGLAEFIEGIMQTIHF